MREGVIRITNGIEDELTNSEKLLHHDLLRKVSDEIIDSGGKVTPWITKYQTDGILDGEYDMDGRINYFRLLIDINKEGSFTEPIERSKVLIKVLCCLKDMDNCGEKLPDVILVGDVNIFFVVHINFLLDYLYKRGINLSVDQSMEGHLKQDLIVNLTENEILQGACHVHVIEKGLGLQDFISDLKYLITGNKRKVILTDRNIRKIFDYFTLRILKRKINGDSLYEPREQVEYFMRLVLENDNCYGHPKKRGVVFLDGIEVKVEKDAFEAFQNYYEFEYTAEEKKDFTAIADRLIEESDRRFKGDFYTPSIWVDEAHKMLNSELGMGWREDYMVWDCASGTKNLTRDYKFEDLYSSSLESHDLEISKNYNKEGLSFQYDFLNDDVEYFDELRIRVEGGHELIKEDFKKSKLYKSAPGLIDGLLNGKKLLFFINPPYGANGEIKNTTAKSKFENKVGISKNKINSLMVKNKLGLSSQQLYAQFIFNIINFKRLFRSDGIKISLFSPSAFLVSTSFSKFREYCYELNFLRGIQFQASNFADVAGNWSISFSILSLDGSYIFNRKFLYGICELDGDYIKVVGNKEYYNLDGLKNSSDWVKESVKGLKKIQDVPMKSALNYNSVVVNEGSNEGSLGYYYNKSNIVNKNSQQVWIVSATSNNGRGCSILDTNFERFVTNFSARRLISGKYADWKNWQDEYMIPNVNSIEYGIFYRDSLFITLFDNKSNQSSLRSIDYGGKSWDILNHFYFMSKDEMLELSLEYKNEDVYIDVDSFGDNERFVYDEIQGIGKEGFSDDAWEVYEMACKLTRDSFKFRKTFDMDKPEYHINSWDAGWYQIKGLLKEYMPDELKEFNLKYKALEDRMRPLVYELGFLKKSE